MRPKVGLIAITVVLALALCVGVGLASPGPVWNIKPSSSNSRAFKQTSGDASANFLLAVSSAFMMFSKIESGQLNQAREAANQTTGSLVASRRNFLSLREMGRDVEILNSSLQKVNFQAVEVRLEIPASGSVRQDWINMASVAKTSGAAGLIGAAVSSTETLMAATGGLVEFMKSQNVDAVRQRAAAPFDLWLREITKGKYVSEIFRATP